MAVDRSFIRVKAMLIAPNPEGTAHVVSLNPPTAENPAGYHRLIGGSVELGETHREAIEREVDEELGARLVDLEHLGAVESIFQIDGTAGHEVVLLHTARVDPLPAVTGATLTESDGSVVPLVWRSFVEEDETLPLYPLAVGPYVARLRESAGYPLVPRTS